MTVFKSTPQAETITVRHIEIAYVERDRRDSGYQRARIEAFRPKKVRRKRQVKQKLAA